jgi:hypothetical protein
MRIAHQSSQQNPQETLTAAGFACTRENHRLIMPKLQDDLGFLLVHKQLNRDATTSPGYSGFQSLPPLSPHCHPKQAALLLPAYL